MPQVYGTFVHLSAFVSLWFKRGGGKSEVGSRRSEVENIEPRMWRDRQGRQKWKTGIGDVGCSICVISGLLNLRYLREMAVSLRTLAA